MANQSKPIEDEIRQNLLNDRLYKPLKESTIEFTTFNISGTDPAIQHLFELPVYPINYQASTSAGVYSSMSPPPPPPPTANKPIPSRFNDTVVVGKVRECQLCDRVFGNRLHQRLYREQNICCICRHQFPDELALIEHVQQTIKANICCMCKLALTDDPQTNENHFKRHRAK